MIAVLRLLHIVLGGFWAGGTMLLGWLAIPVAREIGPAAGPFMQGLLRRRLSTIMPLAGVLTVAAGIWLWFLRPPVFETWRGYSLAIGALSAIVGLTIGIVFQRPTAHRMQVLGQTLAGGNAPPTPEQGSEMGRLQVRMASYGNILAYLLALALAGMALGGA
jgi:hypothetical protein